MIKDLIYKAGCRVIRNAQGMEKCLEDTNGALKGEKEGVVIGMQ